MDFAIPESVRPLLDKIERFIADRSEADFTHSFCPTCGKTHYPDFEYDAPSTTANRVN